MYSEEKASNMQSYGQGVPKPLGSIPSALNAQIEVIQEVEKTIADLLIAIRPIMRNTLNDEKDNLTESVKNINSDIASAIYENNGRLMSLIGTLKEYQSRIDL